MNHQTLLLALASALLLCATTSAQEQADKARRRDPVQKLRRAFAANADLKSLRFTTEHRTLSDATMANFLAGPLGAAAPTSKGRKVRTSGVWSGDLLTQSFGDREQVVFRGRRMIAKDSDREWTPRRGIAASGNPLPFVLDPQNLFLALHEAKFSVVHNSVGDVGGRPVAFYTIRVEGRSASDLLQAGAIPSGRDSTPSAQDGAVRMVTLLAAGGALGGAAHPKMSVEVVIALDPATQKIHRVHGRSVTKSPAVPGRGRIVIQGGAALGGAAEDVEEEEEDAKAVGTFKDGLSVLAKKVVRKSTIVSFTYELADHGQATVGDLDPRARRLLGLPVK